MGNDLFDRSAADVVGHDRGAGGAVSGLDRVHHLPLSADPGIDPGPVSRRTVQPQVPVLRRASLLDFRGAQLRYFSADHGQSADLLPGDSAAFPALGGYGCDASGGDGRLSRTGGVHRLFRRTDHHHDHRLSAGSVHDAHFRGDHDLSAVPVFMGQRHGGIGLRRQTRRVDDQSVRRQRHRRFQHLVFSDRCFQRGLQRPQLAGQLRLRRRGQNAA
ncbi:hypothetical protein SDC9_153538 [bioreactor metagenome]|uniref:Uncharacterized protein n=1 Tax=bioreactor metagenome TaxID=1076179 RepID=A0A645EYG0_9ZZZZ